MAWQPNSVKLSFEEHAGRYALLILLVLTKRTRRAIFRALTDIGEL
jgi:hypothetical protein